MVSWISSALDLGPKVEHPWFSSIPAGFTFIIELELVESEVCGNSNRGPVRHDVAFVRSVQGRNAGQPPLVEFRFASECEGHNLR